MRLFRLSLVVALTAAEVLCSNYRDVSAQRGQEQASRNGASVSWQNNGRADSNYWTAERLANAQPLELPQASFNPATLSEAAPAITVIGTAGRAPSAGTNLGTQLYRPDSAATFDAEEIAPQNWGTFNAPFSSSQLVPQSADQAYPHSAIGKFFFTDPVNGLNYVCSASAISYRVIATAGHLCTEERWAVSIMGSIPISSSFRPCGTAALPLEPGIGPTSS